MVPFLASVLVLVALFESGPQTQTHCATAFARVEPVVQLQSATRPDAGGFLGVRLSDIDTEQAKALKLPEDRGVEIKAVMEGSPADRAGVQPGDVILTYNGEPVLGAQQLSRLVLETPPGRHVKVQYWRDGKAQTAVIEVGAGVQTPGLFRGFPAPNWETPNIDVPTPLLVWRNAVIGIEFERVDAQLASYFGVRSGVLIRSVQHGSPADRAGLRAGDVIFSIAQQTLSTEHDFSSLLRHGPSVPLSVMRDHKRIDLTIAVP
jgi:serine protease Do